VTKRVPRHKQQAKKIKEYLHLCFTSDL